MVWEIGAPRANARANVIEASEIAMRARRSTRSAARRDNAVLHWTGHAIGKALDPDAKERRRLHGNRGHAQGLAPKRRYQGTVQVPRLTMGREHNAGQFQNDAVRTLHEMTRFDAERERDPAG